MELYVSVTRHQIASALSDEEAISLIKVIDEEKADWDFTKQIAEVVVEIYKNAYPEIENKKNKIFEELEKEEDKFRKKTKRTCKRIFEYSNYLKTIFY